MGERLVDVLDEFERCGMIFLQEADAGEQSEHVARPQNVLLLEADLGPLFEDVLTTVELFERDQHRAEVDHQPNRNYYIRSKRKGKRREMGEIFI